MFEYDKMKNQKHNQIEDGKSKSPEGVPPAALLGSPFSTEDLKKEIEEYREVLKPENTEKNLIELFEFLYGNNSDENMRVFNVINLQSKMEERQRCAEELKKAVEEEIRFYEGIKYNEKGYAYSRTAIKVLQELLSKLGLGKNEN